MPIFIVSVTGGAGVLLPAALETNLPVLACFVTLYAVFPLPFLVLPSTLKHPYKYRDVGVLVSLPKHNHHLFLMEMLFPGRFGR
jgi:hypothetical protein